MSMSMHQIETFKGHGISGTTTLQVPDWVPVVVGGLAFIGGVVLLSWAFKGVRAVGVGTREGVRAAGKVIKA